jgi:hypothetical protein
MAHRLVDPRIPTTPRGSITAVIATRGRGVNDSTSVPHAEGEGSTPSAHSPPARF